MLHSVQPARVRPTCAGVAADEWFSAGSGRDWMLWCAITGEWRSGGSAEARQGERGKHVGGGGGRSAGDYGLLQLRTRAGRRRRVGEEGRKDCGQHVRSGRAAGGSAGRGQVQLTL